jgi:hypothetical protein
VGFEPTRALASPGGFQDRCLKPLGHPSRRWNTSHFGQQLIAKKCRSDILLLPLPFGLGKHDSHANSSIDCARHAHRRRCGILDGIRVPDASGLRTGCAPEPLGSLCSRPAAQLPVRMAPEPIGALRSQPVLANHVPIMGTCAAGIDFMIRMMTHRALAIVAIGSFAAAPFPGSQGWAQHSPPPVLLPVPQVTPQFNDPGPQLTIPPPGNPVQQLAPMSGAGSQVYTSPRIYVVPESSPNIVAGRSHHHSARHRHPSRSRAGSSRSSESSRAKTR